MLGCSLTISNPLSDWVVTDHCIQPIIPRKFLFYLLESLTHLVKPTNQVLLCGIHFSAPQMQCLTEGIDHFDTDIH